MKKIKNKNRLVIAACFIVITIIVLLVTKSMHTQKTSIDSYDYEIDKAERFTDFKSDEDSSFSKVKSSINYKIEPFTLNFAPNELTADVSKQPQNYPFEIKSLTHKNNGLLLYLEFINSGFIKDFQLTIKVNENIKVIKQPLIDCSNEIKLYIPYSFNQEINSKVISVTISNVCWKEASITNLATIDYEKASANTNKSDVVIKTNNNNSYNLKYSKLLNLTLEKTSYNSLHLKSKSSLLDLAESLRNLILNKVDTKYYVILINSHRQTNSNKFYLHEKENTILKSDDKIEQIKICIEKE